jgi:chromosomal replication initiation ATPase DnaA
MTPKQIIKAVERVTGISAPLILSNHRSAHIVRARHLVIGLLREAQPTWTLLELALAVGAEDHGTASHALKKCRQLSSDPEFVAQWRAAVALLCRQPATV